MHAQTYRSCSTCQYCMICLYGLDIPSIFVHYNRRGRSRASGSVVTFCGFVFSSCLGPESVKLERGDVFVLKTYFINHISATVNYREQSLVGLNAVYVFDTALFRYPGVGGWENATFFDYLLYLFVLPYWRIGLGRREV